MLLAVAIASPGESIEVITISSADSEPCQLPTVLTPPPDLTVGADYYGRLIPPLRSTAQLANPETALLRAAVEHYRYRRPTPTGPGSLLRARAYADLAVTGRRAYEAFQSIGMGRAEWQESGTFRELVRANVAALAGGAAVEESQLLESIAFAIDRAFDVAWALRRPGSLSALERSALGWIAVSGEDDRPHRPVNTLSAPYPQHDVEVMASGQTLRTRLVFIHPELAEPAATDRDDLPDKPRWPFVLGDIYIFLHGHGSSAEEALSIAEPLIADAHDARRRLSILSVDLPGYAYSDPVDTSALSALPLDTSPRQFGGLELLEEFLTRLIALLEERQPGISEQLLGVMGGSLGGNLALRVARRSETQYPRLQHNVSWSPASVWPSFADSCERPQDGYSGCESPTTLCEDVRCQRETGVWGSHKNATETGDAETRKFFFGEDKLRVPAHYTYADRWYRDGWPCKGAAIEASKHSVSEFFSEDYRKWHWRIAHEQLIYTHWAFATDPQRLGIRSRLLLATGSADNHLPDFIYANTVALTQFMAQVPGRGLLIQDTGHSIHAERPVFFSTRIVEFLKDVPTAPLPPSLIVTAAHLW